MPGQVRNRYTVPRTAVDLRAQVGDFTDGESAMMLVAARLRHIGSSKLGVRKYVSRGWLKKHELES